jgi:glycosyltransferase involved in cell wall biosynthesis
MRILLVARRYWPAVGGVESYLRDVARDLGTRHELTVLALRTDSGPVGRLSDGPLAPPPFEPFEDGPVRVEPLRIPAARRALMAPLFAHVTPGLRRYAYGSSRVAAASLYARAVAPLIAHHAGDVVHAWAHDLLGVAAVRAARLRGVPCVVTPFAHEGQWGDDPASARLYRDADAIVALLDVEAALYRRLGARTVDVVGVCSRGAAGGDGAALRGGHGIDGPLVLFLGVRRPYKGFELLLETAPRVVAMIPNVTFAFVGPGRSVPEVAGVRTVDAGEVDDVERAAWLDAADLLCLPSEGEIFPASFLEAWSAGTPVLASDVPPLRELVEKTGGGLVVVREPRALAEVITELLMSPERLRSLGEAGRRAWERDFTVRAVSTRLEDIYGRALAPREAECAA